MNNNTMFDNIFLEMRRGALVLAVLSQLNEEQYGYSLLACLAERGLEIDQGTLYPLLRRLEAQGMLESSWRIEESRPRRYYILNSQGRELLPRLKSEWQNLVSTLETLLG